MGAHTQPVGETVSHYRILRKIGGGGMGVVYKAEGFGLANTSTIPSVPEGVMRTELSFLLIAFEKER
jgi:hypothetical protein